MAVNGSRVLILKRTLSRLESATVKADLFHALSNLLSTGVVFVGLMLSSIGIYVGDIGAAVILGLLLVYLSVRLIHSSALELSDHISKELASRVKNLAKTTDGVRQSSARGYSLKNRQDLQPRLCLALRRARTKVLQS